MDIQYSVRILEYIYQMMNLIARGFVMYYNYEYNSNIKHKYVKILLPCVYLKLDLDGDCHLSEFLKCNLIY